MEITEESILCMNPKVCSRSFAVFKEKLDMSVVSLGFLRKAAMNCILFQKNVLLQY